MLSAFGVEDSRLSKAQLPSGEYKPTNKLSGRERQNLRADLGHRGARQAALRRAAPRARHSIEDVYRNWGVGPGIDAARKEKTRPSKVHPNVHYGHSVSPELEQKLDSHLNPNLTRRAKHPVVFHHGDVPEQALAAATGAHKTVGNKGHVIISRTAYGKAGEKQNPAPSSLRHVANHEFVHAMPKGQNPQRWSSSGSLNAVKSIGEEARADALGVPNQGVYRRNKVIPGPVASKTYARVGGKNPVAEAMRAGGKVSDRYNTLHRQIRRANTVKHPGAVLDAAKLAAKAPLEHPNAAIIGGTIAAAAYTRHKDKLKKSAFGIDHGVSKLHDNVRAGFRDSKRNTRKQNVMAAGTTGAVLGAPVGAYVNRALGGSNKELARRRNIDLLEDRVVGYKPKPLGHTAKTISKVPGGARLASTAIRHKPTKAGLAAAGAGAGIYGAFGAAEGAMMPHKKIRRTG